MSYKRSLSVILMVILTVMAAGSVSRPVYAETTLERLKKAKAEKEKTEDAKENTEDRKQSLEITKNTVSLNPGNAYKKFTIRTVEYLK